MGKCTANNAQITQMTTAMSDLKSLMSGGPSSLAGMETAQAKIKEGFDILAGKNTGPITLQYCENYDETLLDDYDPVESTVNPPASRAACIAAGGTWVEKEVENFNLHDEINKLSSSESGLEFGTKISDLKKKFADLVPDLQEQIEKISPEAAKELSNPSIPELPKAGDPVDICTCSDPLYTDKTSCEENGGTWNCRKGVMPDLSSLFSGAGLSSLGGSIFSGLGINPESKLKVPSIDPAKVCEFVENVEVKDKVVTDPKTGKQTVEKKKEVPAANPKVAEEPPKVAPPSPPANNERRLGDMLAINSFHRAVTRSLESWMMTFTNEKWNMPKKDAKRVIQVLQYYAWRDFAENVNADFDFVLKIMAIPSVASLTSEKIYAVWVMFYRDYVKKPLTTAGIEKSEKKMYKTWEKVYNKETTSKFSFDVAALIAWKDALEKEGKTQTVVPEYSEPVKVKQNIDIVESVEPPPAEPAVTTGKKSITLKGNTITFDPKDAEYNSRAGAFKIYVEGSKFEWYFAPTIVTQQDLDSVIKVYQSKSGTYEVITTDRSGRKRKTVYDGSTLSATNYLQMPDGSYK